MVMIRAVQVRLTRDQYERLKNNARVKGFSSLSSYIRYVALEHDFFLERKILEIHEFLINPKNTTEEAHPA